MNHNSPLTAGLQEALLPDRRDILRTALRVTAVYTTIAVGWIVASESLARLTVLPPGGFSFDQSARGLLFVAVTASALYLALQRSARRTLETVDRLEQHCRQIEQIRERWTEAFDAIRDPIMLHDGEFRVVRCNEAYALTTGRAYKEILGRHYFEMFPPGERPPTFCPCVHGGEEAGEFTLESGDVYSIFRYPVFGRDGEFEYCMHVFRDVTESKRAQAALERQGQQFRRLIENAIDLIVVLDTRGNIQYINPSSQRVLGFAADEIVGHSALKMVHPDDISRMALTLADSFSDPGAPKSLEFRLRVRDGSWHHLEGYWHAVPGEDGALVAVANWRDVTERVEAEGRLLKVNRSLKTLIGANNALVRAKSEQSLLDMVCKVVVESGGYRLAYVCYAGDDPEGVQPMACQGAGVADVRGLGLDWGENERGHGLAGTALRTGRTVVINDLEQAPALQPWWEWVRGYGLGSGIGLPLMEDGQAFGAVVICASEKNLFDADQTALLEELAGDLSFGVIALRNELKREDAEQRALDHLSKLTGTMERAIEAVALTIEKRDPYTAGHQQRVARLATALARELGLSEDQIRGIHLGGLIHDIGKVYVPAEILNRPGKLSEPEFAIIKTHCQVGYDIIKNVEFPWPVGQIILQHHERLDGSGYPNGLKGSEILVEARIMAVADVVEAITSHRPYRPALGLQIAIDEIAGNRGKLYDPQAVDACLRVMKRPGFSLDTL